MQFVNSTVLLFVLLAGALNLVGVDAAGRVFPCRSPKPYALCGGRPDADYQRQSEFPTLLDL
ncbi:hypothetical protein MJO29_006038 [Puccinia striiformis f. sp. tritici]|nr:hypothetical protein MJO29_006038 [Puccinia striiformis f. sp. tritici]